MEILKDKALLLSALGGSSLGLADFFIPNPEIINSGHYSTLLFISVFLQNQSLRKEVKALWKEIHTLKNLLIVNKSKK